MRRKNWHFWLCTFLFSSLIFGVIGKELFWSAIFAADGGGTNVVSPAALVSGSTGNTLTFTYTADALKDSGKQTLTIPAGWTAPQNSVGSAGYTTVSTSGTLADVKNSLDSATGWSTTTHMTLATNTSDKQEGTGSLQNTIGAATAANEQWYFDTTTQNWGGTNSGNLRVGLWLKSNVTTAAGNISWQDDDTASLASPLDTISIPALTANTWAYTSATLGATTRAAVLSYGLRYTTDIGAATLQTDAISPLFDAADAITNWAGDTNITVSAVGSGQEGTNSIRCTYASAAGIGASGECFRSSATGVTVGPGTTVSFWVRSSVALNAGDFAWVDDDAVSLGSVNDTVNLPALAANTWTFVTLNAASSGNLAAKSWGLRQVVDKDAMTIDIDAMGKMVNTADTTTGWSSSPLQTLSADTTVKKEGTASLKNTILAAAVAGDKWYENFGVAQNWSGYTTVGIWLRSTVATTAGQLQFEYDDTASLASPIASINISALTANTWSYQKQTLTGTHTSILSYGIKYTTDIGAATVNLDYVLAGPGTAVFSGSGPWDITSIFLALTSSQTLTVTYGSGGGSNGVPAAIVGSYSFVTKSQDSSDTTLTSLASSPTVIVNATPEIGKAGASPDPGSAGTSITFTSGTWSDLNSGETVRLFVCKTNALSSSSTGGCSGGTWCSTGSFTATNPQTCSYTSLTGDIATSPNFYYVFLCDAKQVSNSCSASGNGTFTVQNVVTVGTNGTQNTGLSIPSTNQYLGGAFTMIRDSGSTTVSQIILNEKGTVNANSNLSNIQIFYKQEAVCSSSLPAGTTLFNSSGGASFDSSEKATIPGTMTVGTSQICLYIQLDVAISASEGQTIDLEISNPQTDITVAGETVSPGTVQALSGSTTLAGTLTVDMVDGSGNSVASPGVSFSPLGFSYTAQNATGTLGISTQKIRILNTHSGATWSLSLAATGGGTSLWSSGSAQYDYNDVADGSDGADADSKGGQLSVDATPGTLAAVSPCISTTGISKGSSQAFSEVAPIVSSVTLLTASGSAATNCRWDVSGISLQQILPGSTLPGTYTLSVTITVA